MQKNPRLAGIIFALGVAIPGLLAAEGLPAYDLLPPMVWFVIAAVAGGAGVVIHTGERPALAAVLGTVGGLGTLAAIPRYVSFRSQYGSSFFIIELLLPTAVVALPLLAVWQWSASKTQK